MEFDDLLSPEKVTVYGRPNCLMVNPLLVMLRQQGVKFYYIDINADKKFKPFVQQMGQGNESVPLVIFPNGSVYVEPDLSSLRSEIIRLRKAGVEWLK